jgi:hypothetical protein
MRKAGGHPRDDPPPVRFTTLPERLSGTVAKMNATRDEKAAMSRKQFAREKINRSQCFSFRSNHDKVMITLAFFFAAQ